MTDLLTTTQRLWRPISDLQRESEDIGRQLRAAALAGDIEAAREAAKRMEEIQREMSEAGQTVREHARRKALAVTPKPTQPRRKRLPYAANACIEDAYDSAKEAHRLLGVAFKNNGKSPESSLPMAEASHQLSNAIFKLLELKAIQQSGGEE